MAQFDDFRKALEDVGVSAEKIKKVMEELDDTAEKSVDTLQEELALLEDKLANAKALVQQQELQRDIQEKLLEIEVSQGRATQEQLDALRQINATTEQVADKFDNIFDALTGVNSKLQDSIFAEMMKPGGMQGLIDSFQRTFTATNILASGLSKVVEMSVALSLATDNVLVEFNRATGASSLYNNEIMALEQNMYQHGVGIDNAASAYASLVTNVTSFNNMSASTRQDIAETTALLDKFGVSADSTAQNIQLMTSVMGLSGEEAAATSRQMFTLAQSLGMPPAEMAAAFQSAAPHMAKFGSMGTEVFMDVAAAAREANMSIDQLLRITEQFDTFEGAAQAVGKLNAILGGPFLNSLEMVTATNPVDRMRNLSDAITEAGLSFDEMGYYERQAVANAAGLQDVSELALVMAGEFDNLSNSMANMSQSELVELQKQSSDFNTLADKMTQIMRTLALQFQPVVEFIKEAADLFLYLNKQTNGLLPYLVIAAAAIGALALAFITITPQIAATAAALGLIAPVAAPAAAGLAAMSPVVAAAGSAMAVGAPGILAFGAAFLMLGLGVGLAAAGMALFVLSMTQLFSVATPDQMLAFGASLIMIGVGMQALAAASLFLGPVLLLLTGLSAALLGVSYAVSLMNFENLLPLTDLFQAIATIVTGEMDNLTETIEAVTNMADAISNVDDARKIVAVRQVIDSINGRPPAPAAATPAAPAPVAAGGNRQPIYLRVELGNRHFDQYVGELVNGMINPFG